MLKQTRLIVLSISVAATFIFLSPAPTSAKDAAGLPKWVKDVGSRGMLKTRRMVMVDAPGDGTTNTTKAIQKAIDECAKSGGTVSFKPGEYVTGALFLKSNVYLRIAEGV